MAIESTFYSFFGAERGTNTQGDVLVSHTSDGTDLNVVWAEFAQALDAHNQHRSALASLLSYQTTRQIDAVPQSVEGAQFEVASEFGVPQGHRLPNDVLKLGYGFEDYDIASRFTWKFLRDADTRQVEAVHNSVLEGANRKTTTAVLRRLFDPAQHTTPEGNPEFGLYNGDGQFIPPYLGAEFDPDTDTHYLATGSAVLDPSDVETLLAKVSDKGYSADSGRKLLILVNPIEAKIIATFRAGEQGADGVEAHFDFIPSVSAPARLVTEQIVGDQAPAEWNGLAVLGSYGDAFVIQSHFIPKGYVAVVASAGPNAEGNPVGFRVHANPNYQGLRLIPGTDQRYPLISSYYAMGFGVGVRHRGGAAVLQVTTAGSYTAPTFPK
nr:hypothetical protein [Prescottella equi]